MSEDVHLVDVGGHTVQYRRAGEEGPPLVLLHGGWGDSREWWLQLADLSDEFSCFAIDAPGCGGSWDPPNDFGMDGYADTVADVVDALGLERPHLLGLSFGGGLALAVYRRRPSLARSLVLASAYAGWAGSLPAAVVEARVHKALSEAELPPDEWISSYLSGFFTSAVPQESVDRLVSIMRDIRPAGITPMVLAFAAADLRDVLSTISVPTLLLYGELDERAPRAVADGLHAGIPGSELVVMPGVGHVSNIEAPDTFNAEVRRFLQSVDA
jgi:pimeloyl-ACP methyl ester carboxylesterase